MNQNQHPPDLPALPTESLPLGWVGLHRFHALEVVQLSSTINDMLQAKSAEHKRANANALLVPQLREANQNLILATFGALDSLAAAEAANQRQTQFLSMLAHELRNPLHPIIMGKLADALVGLGFIFLSENEITLVAKFADSIRYRVIEAAIESLELFDCKRSVAFDCQIRDRLAEVAVVVHDLVHRELQREQFLTVLRRRSSHFREGNPTSCRAGNPGTVNAVIRLL